MQFHAGKGVLMELRQTAAGVPAPGIDPAPDELEAIKNIEGIFSWLGASNALKDGLLLAFGGGEPKLRDLVYVSAKSWSLAVDDISVKAGRPVASSAPSSTAASQWSGGLLVYDWVSLRSMSRPPFPPRAADLVSGSCSR